jgi:DNA-binding LacI/PurR family transcriptional regulator
MVTRKDVAERAGVSPSTVSYVISGKRTISQETRDRVERAMRELAYTPNAIARSLAGRQNGIVALHFPAGPQGLNTTEFEYLTSAALRAREHGFHVLLWSDPIADIDALRGLIGSRLIDGLVLMEVLAEDPRVPVLQADGIPFALIGRPADPTGVTWVDDDFDSLAAQAIDHVADLGHRHVMYLTHTAADLVAGHGPAVRTLTALESAARRRRVHLTRFHADSTTTGGHEAFERLIGLEPRTTAVIAFNELAVSGLLRAASIAGVRIPADLTVVALSLADVAAEILTPPLTTVAPSASTLATMAMDALVGLINDRDRPASSELLTPVLTIRGSSGPVPRTESPPSW